MPVKERAIKSDLAEIDKLRDEDIGYSDIPELDDEVFAQPLVDWPPKKEAITIRVDSDVLVVQGARPRLSNTNESGAATLHERRRPARSACCPYAP
jgi:hypothetical protein